MKKINPLGRAVLAAGVVAAMLGASAIAFADDYGHGPGPGPGYGDHDQGWQDRQAHHEHPPVRYYQPDYRYAPPPPVVYAPSPPQYYAPPVDMFFSIGIH